MEEQGNKQLFKAFPPISTVEWEEKIRDDLKGADYEKELLWRSGEGFNIKPYYRDEDTESLGYLRDLGSLRPLDRPDSETSPNGWIICQDIHRMDAARSRIREALKGGAEAIRFHLEDLHHTDPNTLVDLLDEISIDSTEIHFASSMQADAIYDLILRHAGKYGIDPASLKGSTGADPLGKMVSTGIPVASFENLGRLVRLARESSPAMRIINVNGALVQNSGSTLVQELGISLAMASEYLSLLSSKGIDPAETAGSMQLQFATGPEYFLEIAKLRAARVLWAKICEAYGIEPGGRKIRIHSTSSEWNMTLYDPYTNMLRATTEAMSAILGGADLVTVLPFDYLYSTSNGFSARIARNLQLVLREESYFDRVVDPAAGSYYIENLTDAIAGSSWELFQEIEARGGFRKAFDTGWIQQLVFASRQEKVKRVASGSDRILGTNAFPDFNEFILARLDQLTTTTPGKSSYEEVEESASGTGQPAPLQPFRISSIFEEVRLETERSGKRPRVYLFKYGNPAWASTRATFSGNFFACAGYEIIDRPASKSIEAGIREAISSGAEITVLCSEDDTCSQMAPAIHSALKEQSHLVIACYPSDSVEALRQAGIEYFIHMKTNHLETLQQFNRLFL